MATAALQRPERNRLPRRGASSREPTSARENSQLRPPPAEKLILFYRLQFRILKLEFRLRSRAFSVRKALSPPGRAGEGSRLHGGDVYAWTYTSVPVAGDRGRSGARGGAVPEDTARDGSHSLPIFTFNFGGSFAREKERRIEYKMRFLALSELNKKWLITEEEAEEENYLISLRNGAGVVCPNGKICNRVLAPLGISVVIYYTIFITR